MKKIDDMQYRLKNIKSLLSNSLLLLKENTNIHMLLKVYK